MPVRLAGFGIREVHLDAGEGDRLDGVEEGQRGVRERRAVQQEAGEPAACGADAVEELALVVRLEGLDGDAELAAAFLEAPVDVGEGLFPVDLGLSRPEELQIRPRKNEDPGRSCLLAQESSAISFGAAIRIR